MEKTVIESGIHGLLNPGCVVLVTAGDKEADGVFPVTWNMPVRKDPPMVAIESSQGHHTFSFIRRTGEFAINIPDASLVDAVLRCGRVSGRSGIDKFAAFGLTREPAACIRAPLVREAFANLECKVVQVMDMGSSALLIAQVVCGVADPRHFRDGQLSFENGLKLLHHLGGDRFCVSDKVVFGRLLAE